MGHSGSAISTAESSGCPTTVGLQANQVDHRGRCSISVSEIMLSLRYDLSF